MSAATSGAIRGPRPDFREHLVPASQVVFGDLATPGGDILNRSFVRWQGAPGATTACVTVTDGGRGANAPRATRRKATTGERLERYRPTALVRDGPTPWAASHIVGYSDGNTEHTGCTASTAGLLATELRDVANARLSNLSR